LRILQSRQAKSTGVPMFVLYHFAPPPLSLYIYIYACSHARFSSFYRYDTIDKAATTESYISVRVRRGDVDRSEQLNAVVDATTATCSIPIEGIVDLHRW